MIDNTDHDVDTCLCNQCKVDRFHARLAVTPLRDQRRTSFRSDTIAPTESAEAFQK